MINNFTLAEAKTVMTDFEKAVFTGLQSKPKFIPSRFFYDKRGGELFQEIMALDEYYLTRTEFEILQANAQFLFDLVSKSNKSGEIEIIELGAGDGLKTRILLDFFIKKGLLITYKPIDINPKALNELSHDLHLSYPNLKVEPIEADYFSALASLGTNSNTIRLFLFLGSNIGNFADNEAIDFLAQLGRFMQTGDILLCGFDLIKDPSQILAAYNDAKGVTSQFNLNLLARINRELEANFDLNQFIHYPVYDPVLGEARSYLISKTEQAVNISALNLRVEFQAWEPIHTEISRKYSLTQIEKMASLSGFQSVNNLTDPEQLFNLAVWKK